MAYLVGTAVTLAVLLLGSLRRRPVESNKDAALRVAEYTALRNEILKRTEIQQQIINFTLVATGAFFTLGSSQQNIRGSFLFLHPVLVFFFAMVWVDQDEWIGRIGPYLWRLEEHVEGISWEHHLRELARRAASRRPPIRDLAFTSARGFFVLSELLAIGLGLIREGETAGDWLEGLRGASPDSWLLLVGIVFVLLTLLVVRRRRPD